MTTKDSILNLAARVRAGDYDRTDKRKNVTDAARLMQDIDAAMRDGGIERLPESFLNLANRVQAGEYDLPDAGVDEKQLRNQLMRVWKGVLITPPERGEGISGIVPPEHERVVVGNVTTNSSDVPVRRGRKPKEAAG